MKISKLKILASGFFVMMLSVFSISNVKAAEEAKRKIGPAEISFNAGVMSKYVFRGQDQNGKDPSLFAGADAALPANIYLGIWTAQVSDDATAKTGTVSYPGSNQEIDFYGGIAPSFGPVTLDLGYISYKYQGATTPKTLNAGEFYAGFKFQQEKSPFSIGAKIFRQDQTDSETTEFSASYDAGVASLSAVLGDTDNKGSAGAQYWIVSASKQIAGLDFTLAYSDNQMDAAGSALSKSTTTLQVKKTF